MTIINNIQKTGNPNVIYSTTQPPTIKGLDGQLWIDDFGGISVLKNQIWIPIKGKKSTRKVVNLWSDFQNQLPFSSANSGTSSGVSASNTAINGRPGIYTLTTGTTTTGSAQVTTANKILLGQGMSWWFDCSIRLPILAIATDSFLLSLGFASAVPGSGAANGVLLQHNHAKFNGNIALNVRKNNGTALDVNSNIPMSANNWFNLSMFINADANNVDFFINKNYINSITTEIPKDIATNEQVNAGVWIRKSSGTIARTFDIDYMQLFGVNHERL